MDLSKERQELLRLGSAFASIAFTLWAVLPMYALGLLTSALGRHPLAEKEISEEPIYTILLWWQGGMKSFPIVILLMMLFALLFALSYILRKTGHAEDIDGMGRGRVLVRKFLIPSFLSAIAFGSGVVSAGAWKGILGSSILLLIFAMFAGWVHYIADTTEK